MNAHHAAAVELRRLIGDAELEDHIAREARRDREAVRAALAAERAAKRAEMLAAPLSIPPTPTEKP